MPTCVALSKVSIEGLSRGTLAQVLLPNYWWGGGGSDRNPGASGRDWEKSPVQFVMLLFRALAELISGGGTWNLTPSNVNTFPQHFPSGLLSLQAKEPAFPSSGPRWAAHAVRTPCCSEKAGVEGLGVLPLTHGLPLFGIIIFKIFDNHHLSKMW